MCVCIYIYIHIFVCIYTKSFTLLSACLNNIYLKNAAVL